MIAEVVFNIPLDRSFHYLIPDSFRETIKPGMRVAAPFGPRERVGMVVRLLADTTVKHLKAIRRVLDPMPVIAEERWDVAAWLSSYYYCSLGEALSAMVPSALRWRAAESAKDLPGADQPRPSFHPPRLSRQQEQAWEVIEQAVDSKRFRAILLHGVTASGKTELYLRAIDRVLAQGRSAIYLIPEIALTPQAVDRFQERFGNEVAVWHSRQTSRARALAWARLAGGGCRLVIGARSAVFAPVQRPGLIILDEEHEPTYKQEDTPRYHARDVAMARARLTGAIVLLGSATPSIESYAAAARQPGGLVTLSERIEGRALPKVELVDLREEMVSRRNRGPLSIILQRALAQTIERGEQAILLLNRRGFARVIQCKTCGEVTRCRRCSVPLIYHASRRILLCHYCNFQEEPEELCAHCRKGYLTFRGSGTERIESELHRVFPTAAIARMDRDAMTHREQYRAVYDAVRTNQVGILVGTQMVAKGHDFPQVTLVGVVSADTALNLPDFRAGERTFDLLTQVAGRAGRGSAPGRVIIQTFCPDHYAIQAAKDHDYQRFYAEEITMRKRLQLPPFVRLIELTVMGSSRQRVEASAARLADALRRAIAKRRIALLGPAPHRVMRLRRTYRMCLLLKSRSVETMAEILRHVLEPGRRFGGLPVLVNVDPL